MQTYLYQEKKEMLQMQLILTMWFCRWNSKSWIAGCIA